MMYYVWFSLSAINYEVPEQDLATNGHEVIYIDNVFA